MCAISGFYSATPLTNEESTELSIFYSDILVNMMDRGRDSIGGTVYYEGKSSPKTFKLIKPSQNEVISAIISDNPDCEDESIIYDNARMGIFNTRGEPTVEFVREKNMNDVQPFMKSHGNDIISVVHNGLLSNDKDIIKNGTLFGDKVKTYIDSYAFLEVLKDAKNTKEYKEALEKIDGGYAIMFTDGKRFMAARNHIELHGIYYVLSTGKRIFIFATKKEYLCNALIDVTKIPFEVPPYSILEINGNEITTERIDPFLNRDKACVILSGGLDSTTSATAVMRDPKIKEVYLVHFLYKCLAEKNEKKSIIDLYNYFKKNYPNKKIHLKFIKTDLFYELGSGSIVKSSEEVSRGDEGVETLNAWIPFRNGVMISHIAAICDAYDIGLIALGLNLEEGSIFSDNTSNFYEKFNKVLEIGSTSRPLIINPVGHLMKHEIVAYAKQINAPIHLSYSCYHGTETHTHCGECGPCIMRKKAHEMNNIPDSVTYLTDILEYIRENKDDKETITALMERYECDLDGLNMINVDEEICELLSNYGL